jgi:alkylhydroperoxidase/carboxymuconolactone decarboxylase family protein YurZ
MTEASDRDVLARMGEHGRRGHFAPLAESQLAQPLRDVAAQIGETWARPGLSTRDHFLAQIGMMSVLNRQHEFREHIHGALSNGLVAEELVEVFLHTARYAGMPAAIDAMLLLLEVLREAEGDGPNAESRVDSGIRPEGELR